MDKNAQLAAEIRLWMNEVMDQTGLTPTTWSQKAEVARTTIARAVKESYPFVTSSRTLSKLASAAGVEPPNFRSQDRYATAPIFLPVRHRAQAGHWIEVDFAEEAPPAPPMFVPASPGYSNPSQWLELVVGDSVDREIPAGSFVHVVDAIERGYRPRTGDFVVVQRARDGGRLLERSIKQVEIRPDNQVELWPRSHNPQWNTPLCLDDAQDGVTAEIVGLVIASYRRFR